MDRIANLKTLHELYAIDWSQTSAAAAERRWAIVFVAPAERRGVPELTIETHDGELAELLELARSPLADLLYVRVPVEICDLDRGVSVKPDWAALSFLPTLTLSALAAPQRPATS